MANIKVNTGESSGHSPGAYYKEPKLASIDINDKESLENWTSVLNISKKDLLKAIENFGPIVRDIRRGLAQNNDDAA